MEGASWGTYDIARGAAQALRPGRSKRPMASSRRLRSEADEAPPLASSTWTSIAIGAPKTTSRQASYILVLRPAAPWYVVFCYGNYKQKHPTSWF